MRYYLACKSLFWNVKYFLFLVKFLGRCIQIEMLTPKDYIGPLMELAQDRRGDFKEMKFITESRASITYELPLAEVNLCPVIVDFLSY